MAFAEDVLETAQRFIPRFFHTGEPAAVHEAPSPDDLVAKYAFPLDFSTVGYGLTPEVVLNPDAVEQLLTEIGSYRTNPIYTSEARIVADEEHGNTLGVNIRWNQGLTQGDVTYAVARLSPLDPKRLALTDDELQATKVVLLLHGVITNEEAALFDTHFGAYEESKAALQIPSPTMQYVSPMLQDEEGSPLTRTDAIQKVWRLQDTLRLARQNGQEIKLDGEINGEAGDETHTVILTIGEKSVELLRDTYSDGVRVSAPDMTHAIKYFQTCKIIQLSDSDHIYQFITLSPNSGEGDSDGSETPIDQLLRLAPVIDIAGMKVEKPVEVQFVIAGQKMDAKAYYYTGPAIGIRRHIFILPIPGAETGGELALYQESRITADDLVQITKEFGALTSDAGFHASLKKKVDAIAGKVPFLSLSSLGFKPAIVFDPTQQQLVLELACKDEELWVLREAHSKVTDFDARFRTVVSTVFQMSIEGLYERLNRMT